jgi:hypothetical protein
MAFFLLSFLFALPGVPTESAGQDLRPPLPATVDGARNSKKKSVKVGCCSPESEGGGVRKIKGLDDSVAPHRETNVTKGPTAILIYREFQSG